MRRRLLSCSLILKSKKRKVLLFVLCALFVVVIKKKYNVCTEEPHLLIQNLCNSYASGQSVGNLCEQLCQSEEVPSLTCFGNHQNKKAVFTASWKNNTAVFKLIKKISTTELQNWLAFNRVIVSENSFSDMIKTTIIMKFNMSISTTDAKKMSYVKYNQQWSSRYNEMENIWSLLQDNEYLALVLYEKFNIFPKLLGTCGSLYAVQKLNSISGSWDLLTLYNTQQDWERRIQVSLMILDFLLHLENDLPEPLHICDVKLSNFGTTNDFKRVMYTNLDAVHPLSVASRITGRGSHCSQHSDCDFLDCRSFCNMITFKCQHGVVNNNLQIVCEKIFLGLMLSGRLMVPGLLLSSQTPRVLVELLESCANPASEIGTPRALATKEIRTRLYTLLVNLKS